MRYREILQALNETDYSAFVEDDAENQCADVLAGVLQNIIYSAHGAEIPKIRVDALIPLVQAEPGGEAFNFESLKNCQQNDEGIKEMIANIKEDDSGVKYVYLNRVDDMGLEEPADTTADTSAVKTAPEKTVSSMANRALSNRS